MEVPTVAILLIGLLSGLAIGWLLAMQKMRGDIIRTEERMKAQSASESTLKMQMENLAADIGRKQNEDFLRLAEERATLRIDSSSRTIEEVVNIIVSQYKSLHSY